MSKRTPGLHKRGTIWHIDKQVDGTRLRESTNTGDIDEAERYLAHRIAQLRSLRVYGKAPKVLFQDVASRYYKSLSEKRQGDVRWHLQTLHPWIGLTAIDEISMTQLQPYTDYCLGTLHPDDHGLIPTGLPWPPERTMSAKTVKLSLEVVRRVLRLCATDYRNEVGKPLLKAAPLIRMPSLVGKQREPEPLTRAQQQKLFDELPPHLHAMCLFKVNTGCREQEVCRLQWKYEIPVPELGRSIFLIPIMDAKGNLVKNKAKRLVVLNDIAWQVVEEQRGRHPDFVFVYEDPSGARSPIQKLNNTAWKNARARAGLTLRVHDLKHTFGARLRAAGVIHEDRQILLGHKTKGITTHYSTADLSKLQEVANRVTSTAEENAPSVLVLSSGVLIR